MKAYHAGDRLLVEVDVVLPAAVSLCEAHDVVEGLQNAIECLDEVERAFVRLHLRRGRE